VGGANIPHESWNFDLDNVRNPDDKVYGFAKFTHPPKVEGSNNLIVFYSQNKIVGFYGKAEILKDWVSVNEQESYNLIGEKELAVVLENKIENLKEKGFLEDKERVGQVGFSYLEKVETVMNIIEESIGLNPAQFNELNKIKDWVLNNIKSNNNNNMNAPSHKLEFPSIGNGIAILGGIRNRVEKNIVLDHKNYGISVVPNLDERLWLGNNNIVKNNIVFGSGRGDIALGGPVSYGNCFEENIYNYSSPVLLEELQGCDGFRFPYTADLSSTIGLLSLFVQVNMGDFEKISYKNQPIPPEQPTMPLELTKIIEPGLYPYPDFIQWFPLIKRFNLTSSVFFICTKIKNK
jgi:hypothetical protein